MKRIIVLPLAGIFLISIVIVLLMAGNLYTFHRLSDEAPIAELRFTAVGPEEYRAAISYGDFCKTEYYTLYGNQWRLDARFLKWHSWANLFGLDALYRIERLSGRYADVGDENTGRTVAYRLYPQRGIDLVAVLNEYDGFLSPVDTLYGSSVYEDMRMDYRYRVYRGQSGLLVRKQRLPDPDATDGGVITIEINSACTSRQGVFDKMAGFAGRLFHSAGN
jgi:hypothetical protein